MVIVILEPDVFLRFSIVESLRREGYTLIHAAGIEHILVIVSQNPVPVDMVLLSLESFGPHELETCREIAARSPRTRTVVMSGSPATQQNARALKWPVIPKPIRGAALRQRVRTLMRSTAHPAAEPDGQFAKHAILG